MIPVTPRTSAHLVSWCDMYQTSGTVPQPKHVRFAIGVYQITQGMSWTIASPVRWQSFCSASMHFIMCATAHDLRPHAWFPDRLDQIDTKFMGWENVMLRVGKAQQQVVYALHSSASSTRASRYNPAVLDDYLYDLACACFALAPPEYREQGCFDEMHVLTGDLPVKV